MKAILTRYIGATDTRGSRISASAEGGNRVVIPYPDEEHQGEAAHRVAAVALVRKMGWGPVALAAGGMPNGGGYVFCMVKSEADLFEVGGGQ
jgi:hypothetical protein